MKTKSTILIFFASLALIVVVWKINSSRTSVSPDEAKQIAIPPVEPITESQNITSRVDQPASSQDAPQSKPSNIDAVASPPSDPNSDSDLYKKLESTPSGDEKGIRQALFELALNSKDKIRALEEIKKYGILGFPQAGSVINDIAVQNMPLARQEAKTIINELSNVSGQDEKALSSICGSIANISNLNMASEILDMIKKEGDDSKRVCLFGIFPHYTNTPLDIQKQIINQALADKHPGIRVQGKIWDSYNRILNSTEMAEEYKKLGSYK
ncbi:MAG: hypothetical protein M3Q07_02125 [Pseudobdellovibrionaceae bacterium]|nr:hypothetical protein [Pseudobdellovibrionaceae bacterium]